MSTGTPEPHASDTVMPDLAVANTLPPGLILDDRFEVISLVGRGGMSVVYRCRHLHLDRQVAVKMLHPHLIGNEDALRRFQREAQAVSALEHPNIIKVY